MKKAELFEHVDDTTLFPSIVWGEHTDTFNELDTAVSQVCALLGAYEEGADDDTRTAIHDAMRIMFAALSEAEDILCVDEDDYTDEEDDP